MSHNPKTITATELETALQEYLDTKPQVEVLAYNKETGARDIPTTTTLNFDWCGDYASYPQEVDIEIPNVGKFEFVEMIGGEGDGKYWGAIWKLGDRFFVKDGYYSSWDSSEFDGQFREVEVREVMRKVWFEVGTDNEVY